MQSLPDTLFTIEKSNDEVHDSSSEEDLASIKLQGPSKRGGCYSFPCEAEMLAGVWEIRVQPL